METSNSTIDDIPEANPQDPWQSREAQIDPLNIPSAYKDGLNMLEHLLHDKSTIYTSKILAIIIQYKIKADDPIFLLLLCVSELEQILVNLPLVLTTFGDEMLEEMEGVFQQYFGKDADTQQRFEMANAEYMASVAKGAENIVESVSRQRFYGNVEAIARTIVPAFGALVLTFGLGVFGTLHFAKANTRALVSEGKLTPEQLQSLEWVQSKEGRQARQIAELNDGYIGKPCKQAAKDLDVRFSYGSQELESGFCVLLIEPPF